MTEGDIHPVLKAGELMDKAKIPFCLMASTFLGIYRDKNPIGSIFEFAVLKKDITEEAKKRLKGVVEFAERTSDIGIGILDLKGIGKGNFEIHLVYFKNGYGFHNLTGSECLVWPEAIWRRKNWGKIKWGGREWNTPGNPEKYLEIYYGKDWKTPAGFGWHSAGNLHKLDDVKSGTVKFD